MHARLRSCLATVLALLGTLAQASMGLTELPGLKGDGPVTVFYASDSPAAPVVRGPFNPSLALNGRAIAGNRRLIVLSHGSGGAPWVHTDLAQALVDVGFVVALPEHRGDNYKDSSAPGPESWKQRPAEVSRAIDAVAQRGGYALILRGESVVYFDPRCDVTQAVIDELNRMPAASIKADAAKQMITSE